jgi:soluble lytic murein transglycosylase
VGTVLLAGSVWAPCAAPAQVIELTEPDGTVHLTNVPDDPRYQRLGIAPPPWTPAAPADLSPGPAPVIEAHIRAAAQRYGLSEPLVAAVIAVESGFNPRAVSAKGARGLMQLMPATARQLGVRNVFDPAENIDGGVRHLRGLMERFEHNLPLALAAYNAGEGAVAQYGGVPPYQETRQYVTRVLRLVGPEASAASQATESGAGESEGRPLYTFVTEDGATVYTNVAPRPR